MNTGSSKTLWFTGLSGAGKSTLAGAIKNRLEETGHIIKVFDGDEIRKRLNKDLGFSLEDRFENIRRVAEVNKLFLDFGICTINAFISPTNDIRTLAKMIIGEERFFEIYLTTPLETCIERDTKGFYKKIEAGQLKNFTGVDSLFEPSTTANLYLDTSQISLANCVDLILNIFDPQKYPITKVPKSINF
jgi:adenylylsulfate kinase